MTRSDLSKHALQRMDQRGFRRADVDLIELVGTRVDDGFIVRECDCQEALRAVKRLADDIQRISGARLVVEDGMIRTLYRPRRTKERQLLREAEERELRSHPNDRRAAMGAAC